MDIETKLKEILGALYLAKEDGVDTFWLDEAMLDLRILLLDLAKVRNVPDPPALDNKDRA